MPKPLLLRAAKTLLRWQTDHGRHDLPWQLTHDPYRIWLAEVMLQQTQVQTVLAYYAAFLAAFPTLDDLAHAPIDQVLKLWAGLGYYRRAHHLHQAAQTLTTWPQFSIRAEDWQTLPGIGKSTAASIVSSAFATPRAILDGNVKRVFARVLWGKATPSSKSLTRQEEEQLWEFADTMMATPAAQKQPRQWNQALMDLGATLCTRTPQCHACPWNAAALKGFCQFSAHTDHAAHTANETLTPSSKPLTLTQVKPIKPATTPLWLLLMVRQHRGAPQIWLEKRANLGLWAGLWCPPLSVENPTTTLPAPSLMLTPFAHHLTHRHFQVQPWLWQLEKKQSLPWQSQNKGQWVALSSLAEYGIPTLAKKALAALGEKL